MVDDRLEDAGSPPEPGRVKRAPPTIDLDASEVSSATKPGQPAEAVSDPKQDFRQDFKPTDQPEPETGREAPSEPGNEPGRERPKAAPAVSPSVSPSISPWVIAPFSGAVA